MDEILLDITLHTVEDFERFADSPENADRRFELIHGEIFEKMPTEEHRQIAALISHFFLSYVLPRKLGRVTVEPRHCVEGDLHNARMPDVAYTRAERALPVMKKGSVPQMPDLAVEIQMPGIWNRPSDLRSKAIYYLKHSASQVWLVYPAKKMVEVCTLNPEGVLQIQQLEAEESLDGGAVLPGFSLPINDIFETA
jgi:Uma2 family endonuclease